MLAKRFTVRPTSEQDGPHIGPLMRKVWLATYREIHTKKELLAQSHRMHQPVLLLAELSDPQICSFVAEVNGKVVGHARADLRANGTVYVVRLYLEYKFHGNGIGGALLAALENHFSDTKQVQLDVYEKNETALRFYLAKGYRIVGRNTKFQSKGEDVFELKVLKTLGASE